MASRTKNNDPKLDFLVSLPKIIALETKTAFHLSSIYLNMANTKSALKRIRQTETRTLRNRAALSRIKTLRKKVATAVELSDKDSASTAYNDFASAIDKAVKTGKVHANRAANYKSKAAKAIAKIA